MIKLILYFLILFFYFFYLLFFYIKMFGNNGTNPKNIPSLTGEEISITIIYYTTALLIIIISLIFINMRI